MAMRLLRGTRDQIAEQLLRIEDPIVNVVVITDAPVAGGREPSPITEEEFFAEMGPHVVHVGDFDDSREAIYARQAGE